MAGRTSQSELPLSEVVEAQGHLIDSHIMEQIFDSVVEAGARFEVEHFSIGRTNSDSSSLRLRVEAPTQEQMERLMTVLIGGIEGHRLRPVRSGGFLFHHEPANVRAEPRAVAGSR